MVLETKRQIEHTSQKTKSVESLKIEVSITNINTTGKGYKGQDSNTTLSITHNKAPSIVMLDSGARIGIIAKKMLEIWELLAMRKARMILKLGDGKRKRPMGLLEVLKVISCGINCMHKYVVVELHKDPNCNMILGGNLLSTEYK